MTDSFDLTDEPWVPVHLLDGTVQEVSLREVFSRAADARALTGELPTMAFALLRLLLAILHRAVDGPRDARDWADLWTAGALPVERIAGYLDEYRGRFDLLSPATPFFQVAGLATAKGESSGLDTLIADVPNNIRLFPNRHGRGLASLSFAEAARWVVHAQAFEPSGIRGAAVGDPRAKGGKVYPIGTGWAGAIGGVYAEGTTLLETLLLNLGPVERDDLPVWERPVQTAAAEGGGDRLATGRVDAFTWQKARIRLSSTQNAVTAALVTNGDRATLTNQQHVEPMTAWRYSKNQSTASGPKIYFPAQHNPDRLFWRGLSAMLPQATRPKDSTDPIPPGVTSWLAQLADDERLPPETVIRLHAVGAVYGSNNSIFAELVDDVVTVRVAALSNLHPELKYAIDAAVDIAGKAGWAIGVFAANVARAEIGEAAGDSGTARITAERTKAETATYAALDAPFRAWIASLEAGLDDARLFVERRAWTATVRRTVLRLEESIAAQAPAAAYVARPPARPMCVPVASRHLREYLAKEKIMIRAELPDG